MTIYVCDDENNILDTIKNILIKLDENSLIKTFDNTKKLQEALNEEKIDILFMDIKLKDTNGIDFIKHNEKILEKTKIIYITGYSEYIEDIFETNPLYFLQKPLSEEKIKKALKKAKNQIINDNKAITIKVGGSKVKIKIKDIFYIESCARTLNIYLENQTYTTYEKLSMFEDTLTSNFLRIHKSFVVNMDKITKYKNKSIVLENDKILNISRSYSKRCRETLLAYLENNNLEE